MLTLPFEASRSFTGHSLTEARKQYKLRSEAVAPGYQAKSTIGDGWRNTVPTSAKHLRVNIADETPESA